MRKSYYATLRKRVQELKQYFTLLNQARDAICLLESPSLRFLDANQSACEIFNYSPEEMKEKLLYDAIDPEVAKSLRDWVHISEQESEPHLDIQTAIAPQGKEERIFQFLFSRVSLHGQKYIVSVARDITHQKHAEVERLRLETELNQAQKMEAVGQLAGGIAHDFNNILTTIQGNAELLNLSIASDSEDADFVHQIIQASLRAADLTKQLLGFARKGQFQIVSVDAHKVINDVISLLSHSIDKRIEIKKDLKAAPSIVAGDPSQLENALLNLGLNARDAMPEGGSLIFSTRITVLDDAFCQKHPYEIIPGNYIQICVTDTGVGMSKDIQTRIFEPFFTTKPQGEGTGLGLAGVYGCVKSHNGSIQVYSELGHGTTFKIYLPLTKKEAELIAKTPPEGPVKGEGHILVVDDEQSIREFTGRALKNLGYSATLCENGIEAINYFKDHTHDVDLVILDLVMPKLSGEDTFRSLREINPTVKVIISSGFTQHDKSRELLKNGAAEILNKPFRVDELSQQVARHIRKLVK